MMKKVFICLFLLLTLISATYASESKKVLMIIASQNFRDEEFLTPKQIFEKAGFNVIVASSSLNTAKGTLGATVKPDILIKDVNVKAYDAVVFVGGPGAEEYFHNPVALKIAQEAYKEGKIVGAICIAPRILAEAGILKGKKATVFHSQIDALKAKEAIHTGKDVEVDGKIVTASGPKAADKFGNAIVKLLK